MKYLHHILLVSVIVSVTASARTDSTSTGSSVAKRSSTEIFLSGGIPIPYLPEDFRQQSKSAWTVAGGYGVVYEPGSVGFSTLFVNAEYSLFHFDETGYINALLAGPDSNKVHQNPGFSAEQRPTKIFSAFLNYQGTFATSTRSIAPYFLVGVGYMYVSVPELVSTTGSVPGYSKSAVSWTVGLGVDVPFSETTVFFVQGKTVMGVISEATRQTFPITAGLRYRF